MKMETLCLTETSIYREIMTDSLTGSINRQWAL